MMHSAGVNSAGVNSDMMEVHCVYGFTYNFYVCTHWSEGSAREAAIGRLGPVGQGGGWDRIGAPLSHVGLIVLGGEAHAPIAVGAGVGSVPLKLPDASVFNGLYDVLPGEIDGTLLVCCLPKGSAWGRAI